MCFNDGITYLFIRRLQLSFTHSHSNNIIVFAVLLPLLSLQNRNIATAFFGISAIRLVRTCRGRWTTKSRLLETVHYYSSLVVQHQWRALVGVIQGLWPCFFSFGFRCGIMWKNLWNLASFQIPFLAPFLYFNSYQAAIGNVDEYNIKCDGIKLKIIRNAKQFYFKV